MKKRRIIAIFVTGIVVAALTLTSFSVYAAITSNASGSGSKNQQRVAHSQKNRPPMDGRDGGRGWFGGMANVNKIAATVMNTTETAVETAIQNGTSLGSQLTAAGKLDAFKTAYLAAVKTKFDTVVKSGKMTQTQADQIYNKIQTSVNAWDGTGNMPMGGPRDGRGGWHGRWHGERHGGFDDGQPPVNSPNATIAPTN